MPIVFKCPCGQQLRAKDDKAGRTVTCPACKNAIEVPAPDAVGLGIDLRQEPNEMLDIDTLDRRSSKDRLDLIEDQVERLSRANSRWRALAIAGVSLAVLAGLGAYGAHRRLDQLGEFIFTKKILVSNGGSMLEILASEKGPLIAFHDSYKYFQSDMPGARRLVLGVSTKGRPFLTMFNKGDESNPTMPGKSANTLTVDDTGSIFNFADKDGRVISNLMVTEDGLIRQEFIDRAGRNRIIFGFKRDGTPGLMLTGSDEKSHLDLSVTSANEPYMVIFNPDGSIPFQVPRGFIPSSPR